MDLSLQVDLPGGRVAYSATPGLHSASLSWLERMCGREFAHMQLWAERSPDNRKNMSVESKWS